MSELQGVVILVVEDDPDARELMHTALEQRGATVHVAESVERAFTVLETIAPHVIVSDIAMPEEDGVAFMQRLRAAGTRTPSIAVSAYVAPSDRARAMAAGFDRYLHKPVDFDQLVAAVRSVLPAPG